jgi:hypothetical protein
MLETGMSGRAWNSGLIAPQGGGFFAESGEK